MKRQLTSYLFFSFIIVLFVIFSAPEIRADPLSFKDNKGTVIGQGRDYVIRLLDVPGTDIKTAEALFLVRASQEEVYKIITDFDHYPEFMPNITKTTLLERSGTNTKCRFVLKVALLEIKYILLLKSDAGHRPYSLTWEFIEGDINDTSGSWLIDRAGGASDYCLVHYAVRTDPGRLVPGWIANTLTSESIPDMIAAIKSRAEKSIDKTIKRN